MPAPEFLPGAKEFLEANGLPYNADNTEQLKVMVQALAIYDGRRAAYGEVWRNYGALSNLLSMARKTDRLMESWWHGDTNSPPALHKDGLDDAFDQLNYTCFFIRNARVGNITGTAPERPDDVEYVEVVGDDGAAVIPLHTARLKEEDKQRGWAQHVGMDDDG